MSDAFDLLGLEPRFDIDPVQLDQRHRELSLVLHPDRSSGKSPAERRAMLSRAMEVNEARRRLVDPVQRAELLLVRRGVAVGEGREPAAAPELLMEMMERREELREAGQRRDAQALAKLGEAVTVDRQRAEARLAQLLGGEALEASEALRLLGALRYFRRFFDELGALQDELD
ncbi:MAG TPA: Fe-S protein assembly co-chaperone HscB [Polyangiaceae bacterium]|nr:Fe-S protein assembly co-chaperone HscB [Polyangiaceae bacterium]